MNGSSHAGDKTPALPAELLSRIITCLVPAVDRNASTLPHPNGDDLDYTPPLPVSPNDDLLAAVLSCRLLHDLARQALYRTPLLRTLRSLNLLAGTIAADAKKQGSILSVADTGECSHAAWIRSIHLPPGDGLLQPGDTLADQTCYVDSLRVLFEHAARLDFISLDHRQAGAALLEFLRPSTVCRPRQITLSNLSFSAPPFSTTQSLAPLSKLTHLHLIKIVPPPALISFLVGELINTDEQGNVPRSIKAGLSPRETLECLRLSLLPPDALVEFEAYIAWRQAWKVYEQLSAQQQAHEPAPRAPRGPARRFAVQEALYDLATHSSRLPRLRLLLLELSPLGPLPSPSEEERDSDRFAVFTRAQSIARSSVDDASTPSRNGAASAESRKARLIDARARRSDASHFYDAIQTFRTLSGETVGGQLVNEVHQDDEDDEHVDLRRGAGIDRNEGSASVATAEELRIGERDNYWRLIESGKTALVELWSASHRTSELDVQCKSLSEIRVVAAKPNGHDRREGFQDFYCQAQHDSFTVTDAAPIYANRHTSASAGPTGNGDREGAGEVGCWADPDVFSLVGTAPYLSFKCIGKSDQGWYWTGELPRETRQPSSLRIPSRVRRL